ncbi:unnamed protein product [Trichogramma brassicae]|uniref:Uncharacterized protein n=1 Tax=Trichogramma brassicae TaxID=86971 RepID=A0A6H5IQ53_9HYME|nr:unnamed protein product [Trichogramma brassicae]
MENRMQWLDLYDYPKIKQGNACFCCDVSKEKESSNSFSTVALGAPCVSSCWTADWHNNRLYTGPDRPVTQTKSQCHKSELQVTASRPRLEIVPSGRAPTKTSQNNRYDYPKIKQGNACFCCDVSKEKESSNSFSTVALGAPCVSSCWTADWHNNRLYTGPDRPVTQTKSQCHKSELQVTASRPRLEIVPSGRAPTKTSQNNRYDYPKIKQGNACFCCDVSKEKESSNSFSTVALGAPCVSSCWTADWHNNRLYTGPDRPVTQTKSQCHKSELQVTASRPRLEIVPSGRAPTKTSRRLIFSY